MKWALKFSTKGKGAGGGPDAGKAYQAGSGNNFRGAGLPTGDTNGARGGVGVGDSAAFRSSSDGEGPGGDYYEDEGLEPGQERDTPIVTPPDAANGGGGRGAGGGGGGGGPDQRQRGGEKYEASPGDENSSATYEGEDELHNNGSSAPHFTVDSAGRQQRGEQQEEEEEEEGQEDGEEMEYEDGRHPQHGVFDEDGDSQADSLQASKTGRMKSFADDPEAHELEDNAEWDDKADRRDGNGSPRGSPGDERSRNGGEGSHSDHSEAEPNGTEEGYASNPSRGVVDQEGRPLDHEEEGEGEEEEEELVDEEEEDEDEEDDDHDERHHGGGGGGVGNGTRGGGGGGGHGYTNSGDRTSRDQADLERRAMAHAYADGLDGVGSREAPGYMPPGDGSGGAYGSGGDRYQQRNMPPAPPAAGGANGISPVDARAAASLAMRTRLAQGGVAAPERQGLQRPEPGPVLAPGQAAAAAAAALRRGPTPGSHSLPSMVLVPLEALKAHRRVPRSSDRRALVRYRDLPDRSRSFVVFVSHAWMRPHTTPSFAHPDTSSRGGEKYRLIAEAGDRIRAHLPPDVRVLLWIDYSCVDQDSTRRSKATMRGMREYMRRCDAILTVYPGDAADNGEEFLPNRFVKSCAWAGSYKSLAHYCTRGWCRLEMLLGQTEPLPQDGFMFNFLVPKKKKASGAKASVGDRPHFLYGAHQRPHNGRIDVVPRQSSRWFEEHHPEQGNFTHESDRDAIRAVLAKQTSTMAKRSAAIAARYGTDPRRGGGGGGGAARGGGGGERLGGEDGEYGR